MTSLGYKVQNVLSTFGLGVTSARELLRLQALESNQPEYDLKFLLNFSETMSGRLLHLINLSQSQIRQDLLVLAVLNFKRNGFFVEFGAADGLHLSNTYLLEKEFGWTGILAEPARIWHSKIPQNRPETILEKRCVWVESGKELEFWETKNPELSTLANSENTDEHAQARLGAEHYLVPTISLVDLLEKYSAPLNPDYLSIDTEGTEFQILESFDFTKYQFKVITCEHNYSQDRKKVFGLLTSQGYVRVLEATSDFDDWYVLESELTKKSDLFK